MNQTTNTPMTSSIKMLQAMVGIGIFCALAIAGTFSGTLPVIEQNRAEALQQAVFKVIPGTVSMQAFQLTSQNTFVKEASESEGASSEKGAVIYAGYDKQGQLTGLAIEAQGQGYADVITILYGYSPEKQAVVGMYVLASKETPGLGDKIEKDPNFLANFEALDVSLKEDLSGLKNRVIPVKFGQKENPWEVDGITGATISSRAIGNILGESTEKWVPLIYNALTTFNSKDSNE
jgi:electron transport complex protein RnfG